MIISDFGEINKIYKINHSGCFMYEEAFWLLFDKKILVIAELEERNESYPTGFILFDIKNVDYMLGLCEHDGLLESFDEDQSKLIYDRNKNNTAIPYLILNFMNSNVDTDETRYEEYKEDDTEENVFPIIKDFIRFFKLITQKHKIWIVSLH
jgi:hypothetical protein